MIVRKVVATEGINDWRLSDKRGFKRGLSWASSFGDLLFDLENMTREWQIANTRISRGSFHQIWYGFWMERHVRTPFFVLCGWAYRVFFFLSRILRSKIVFWFSLSSSVRPRFLVHPRFNVFKLNCVSWSSRKKGEFNFMKLKRHGGYPTFSSGHGHAIYTCCELRILVALLKKEKLCSVLLHAVWHSFSVSMMLTEKEECGPP